MRLRLEHIVAMQTLSFDYDLWVSVVAGQYVFHCHVARGNFPWVIILYHQLF